MLKIENVETVGWEPTIRGMRNPKNSWDRSDSCFDTIDCNNCWDKNPEYIIRETGCNREVCNGGSTCFEIGENDHKLMMALSKGGSVHAKYRRFIEVYLDITAPLYWWKEFKTYRRGRKFLDDETLPYDYVFDICPEMDADIVEPYIEMNSCSTMHKIHNKEFTIEDFSCEHLMKYYDDGSCIIPGTAIAPYDVLSLTIEALNEARDKFIETKDKKYWWQMIQLLPSSYNQKRTVKLNYEVLSQMYYWRKNHKLDEWHTFCDWIESLPYSEIITGERNGETSC